MSTRFAIASVGKLFTAVALVRLVERGVVTLDARAVDLLPADRRPSGLDAGVTLEHLLSHQSGLTDYIDDAGGQDFAELWIDRNPGLVLAPADLLPLFGDRPPRAAPGAEVRYNDGAFVLARPRAGGPDRALLLRRGRRRGVRAGGDDGDRVPGDGRRRARPRDRLHPPRGPGRAVAHQHLRDDRPGPARRRGVHHGRRPDRVPRRVPRRAAWWGRPGATRCSGRGRGTRRTRSTTAWRSRSHGEGPRTRIGHWGGDPGVGADVSWFPERGDPHGADHERAAGRLRRRSRRSRRSAPRTTGRTPPTSGEAGLSAAAAARSAAASVAHPARRVDLLGAEPLEQREHLVPLLVAEQDDDPRLVRRPMPASAAPEPASSASSASVSDG